MILGTQFDPVDSSEKQILGRLNHRLLFKSRKNHVLPQYLGADRGLYKDVEILLLCPSSTTTMSDHQSFILGKFGGLFKDGTLNLKAGNGCLQRHGLGASREDIPPCPSLWGEEYCSCTFPSDEELQADIAPQHTECLIDQGRCGSRSWTCSRAEVDLQGLTKFQQAQHDGEEGNIEIHDISSYATSSSGRRSSVSSTTSSSLFETRSRHDSCSASSCGNTDSSMVGVKNLHGFGLSDFGSNNEEAPIDFDFYINFEEIKPNADAHAPPADQARLGTLSTSFAKYQHVISKVSSWSPSMSVSESASECPKMTSRPEARCASCDKIFTGKKPERCLQRHLREVHWKQHKRRCNFCTGTFTREGNYLRHLKNYHKGKT